MAYFPPEIPRVAPGKAIPGMITGYYAWRDNARATRARQAPRTPSAMVIAGADLPLDPQTLFRAPAGSLYTVRLAAPVVPPYAGDGNDPGFAAATEFAVTILGVPDVIVLGHRGAALVAALLGHADRVAALMNQSVQIPGWFTMAEEPLVRALRPGIPDADRPRVLAEEMVRGSIESLMSYPWIVEGVMAGIIGLHGWSFDDETRTLARLDPDSDEFVPI
jgi:carbonic anhydrase